MKICYISLGNFTHISPYLDFFKSRGHEVCLIALSPGPDRDIPVFNVGLGGGYSATSGKWKYVLSCPRAKKILNKLQPDIVHAHYATSGGLAAWYCDYHPCMITAHGSDIVDRTKSWWWRFLLNKIFKQADTINVVSDDLKRRVVHLGVDEAKIDVLTLGIDTHQFSFQKRERYSDQRPLKLVNTRRLESVYDPFTVIKALAILKGEKINFRMTFVGSGVLEDKLKQTAKNGGLENNIVFRGGCENAQMPNYLHENDIYLSKRWRREHFL
jgi:glycosyltransferase involved in cell wall biosynthesis